MVRRSIFTVIAVGVTFVAATIGSGPAHASTAGAQYYVALGDSLSQGYMPPAGNSDQGYVDDLYATLHAGNPSLRLVKLGCSGETTTSMLNGGVCGYDSVTSQQHAAQNFLRAHRGAVKYITIDIGANDIQTCAATGTIDIGCALAGLGTIAVNTVKILSGLRFSGGFAPTLVGMTYYNPFLATWLTGPSGQSTARLSDTLLSVLNSIQSSEYKLFGARVADVAGAFKSSDFTDQVTLPGLGAVPVNVANICALTYMCTVKNIHANVEGYQLIAKTFEQALGLPTG